MHHREKGTEIRSRTSVNFSKRIDNIGERMWTVKHFELKSFGSLQNYSRCRQDWCCRNTSGKFFDLLVDFTPSIPQ